VEPLVDNHAVEADICRRFLVSDAGRLAKNENPDGYKNVLLHMQRHMNIMSIMAGPPPGSQQQAPNAAKPAPQQSNDNNEQQKPMMQKVTQNAGTASIQ
jgi:hypothetical protein